MLEIVLFFIIAFMAATIASFTGFGSATILTPFAGLVINLKDAIVLVAFFHFASNAFRLIRLRQSLNRRLVLVYGVPSIITAVGGALLLKNLDVTLLTSVFGAFIIVFSVYSFINPTWSLPDRNAVLVSGGVLSGLTAGAIGLGGAIRSMFLISTKIKKEVYIATSAAIAVMVDITRISVYLSNSTLEAEYYYYIIPLVGVAFVGTFWGIKLLARLPEIVVKRAVLVLLILVGIKMLSGY